MTRLNLYEKHLTLDLYLWRARVLCGKSYGGCYALSAIAHAASRSFTKSEQHPRRELTFCFPRDFPAGLD
jgi:hypothetical protein